MNFIDNIVSFFSPKAGAERAAYRQALNEFERNYYYDAGDNRRINANWRIGNTSAEYTDRYSRDIVRARARDLERNSDMMNSIISAFTRNVVGKGYNLQAQTNKSKRNDQLEDLWNEWCKAKNCDVTNTQSFTQMLRMSIKRMKVDGGILFLKTYTNNGIVPFQLQAIEVDELDTSRTAPNNSKNKVVGGIEYNEYNRPVGFYIKKYSLDGFELMNESTYYKAKDVIFKFKKNRPSQVREMSEVAPVITRIRDANEFMNAVSVKERIMACLSVFIKKALPITGGIGRTTVNSEGKHDYQGKTLSPGMIKELNAGDEVQVVNPSGQSSDAESYTKLQQRLIGAGQGLSYEVTSRDMSQTNYASARQGMIEDGETFAEDEELIISLMDEIYETFVISCVLAGKISASDFWIDNNKLKYFKHSWVKAPKPWIDPAKEASANKIAIETKQKTFKDICAENGVDWKKAIDDMAEVQEYANQKGVQIGGENSEYKFNNKNESGKEQSSE